MEFVLGLGIDLGVSSNVEHGALYQSCIVTSSETPAAVLKHLHIFVRVGNFVHFVVASSFVAVVASFSVPVLFAACLGVVVVAAFAVAVAVATVVDALFVAVFAVAAEELSVPAPSLVFPAESSAVVHAICAASTPILLFLASAAPAPLF